MLPLVSLCCPSHTPSKLEPAQISFLKTPPSSSNRPFIIESQVEIASDTEEMVDKDTDKVSYPPSAAKRSLQKSIFCTTATLSTFAKVIQILKMLRCARPHGLSSY